MAEITTKGFTIPSYSDKADIPTVIKANIENVENIIDSEATSRKSEDKKLQEQITTAQNILVANTTPHQIFVQCDGDHDELKLQAAIENAPHKSVIYPVGECYITNENTVAGYTPLNFHGVILKLPNEMVLDGMYCTGMVFKNISPAEMQVIFQLHNRAVLRNLDIYEEGCTTETLNPMILYAGNNCEVSNCKFYDIFDPYQMVANMYGIHMGSESRFVNNIIDSWTVKTFNVAGYSFRLLSDSTMQNNVFKNIKAPTPIYGYVISTSACNVTKNIFKSCALNGGSISCTGGRFGANYFSDISLVRMVLGGNIYSCRFFKMTSTDRALFETSTKSTFKGCIFHNCAVTSVGYSMVEVEADSIFADNTMITLSLPVDDETSVIYSDSNCSCTNNRIKLSAASLENPNLHIIDGYDKSVCMGNVTNYTSIGRFDSTCILANNVVEEAAISV